MPESLTVSVRAGQHGADYTNLPKGQVIIHSDGDQIGWGAYGRLGGQSHAQQSHRFYQVQTINSKPASIGTSTLVSFATPYLGTLYDHYRQTVARIWIQGRILASSSQGIVVTPTLLPNDQVEVRLSQLEQRPTNSLRAPMDTQHLMTTVIVPRGVWVPVGSISQSQSSQNGGSQATKSSSPIELMLQ